MKSSKNRKKKMEYEKRNYFRVKAEEMFEKKKK